MFNSNIGELIKTLRKQKNLTQDQLSDGICAKDTLWRIENGKTFPHWQVFELIMQKLGEDPRKYFENYAITSDRKLIAWKDELKLLLRKSDDESIKKSELLTATLEQHEAFQEGPGLQLILTAKASTAFHQKEYNEVLKYALEAIKISKPSFDENEIDTYILFFDEIWLINQIAVAHFFITSIERSTEILLKLKNSLDKNYTDDEEKSKTYVRILYNLTDTLGLLKRYDECREYCRSGIAICKKYDNYFYHLPLFWFNMACCSFYTGNHKEGICQWSKAYALFFGLERFGELSEAETFLQKEFGDVKPSFISNQEEK